MFTSDSQQTTKPRRHALAAWLAFGAVGLATGAVWATGFASVGGATGNNDPSPIVAPSAPAAHTPSLSGVVTAGSPLTVDWAGRWGSIPADTNFFSVDLTGEPNTQTYNIAFLLTNTTDISGNGWTSLQLTVEEVDAGAGPCVASAFDGTKNPKVMAFDSQDAGVYWNGVTGGDVYCIGINASDGQDTTGTFLRRDSDTADPTVYPTFLATVDRAS
jgi:hypothetical protein